MSALFQPIVVGGLEFANRLAIAPMCQYSADDGSASDWHLYHWMNLAMSGASMITVEMTDVERRGRISHGCHGLYSDHNELAAKRALEVMKSHPELSVELLRPLSHLEFYAKTLPGVQYHHERFDGRGYPAGIKGEAIPLASRIILVVDTYDAMTWSRPYRKGLSPEVAYKELVDFAGRQFDPKLVEIFNQAHPKWRVRDEKLFQEINNGILSGLSPSPIVHSKDHSTDVA